jgi:hypothetical protein
MIPSPLHFRDPIRTPKDVWSEDAIAQLKTCYNIGMPVRNIAAFLMRRQEYVRAKIKELKLKGELGGRGTQ